MTALCPGFAHTEFHRRMGANLGRIPKWMWLNPDQVVREGLADSARGKSGSLPSRRYSTLIAPSRLVPDRLAGSRGR